MASVYDYCMHRFPLISGKNASSAHVKEVCAQMEVVVNVTRKYMTEVIDLEQRAPVDLAVPLMGYVTPVINILTFFLNTVVVFILTRRRLRSPTNVILVTIAICDTFTAVLPLPEYLYVYANDGYKQYPSMAWCVIVTYISNFVPKFLHTIALWMTALLAFYRYVGVVQLKCEPWVCTHKGVFISGVIIVIISSLCHGFQLFSVLKPITMLGKDMFTPEGLQMVDTCYQSLVVIDDAHNFSYIYTWVRLTFAQVLPCLVLLVCTILLIRVTYRSYSYRRRLVVGHRASEMSETKRTIKLSVMLLLIVSVTCVFELFVNVVLILNFVQLYSRKELVPTETIGKVLLISNFLIFVSFPLNFFFIVMLNTSFRRILTSCFKRRMGGRVTPTTVSSQVKERNNNITMVDILQKSYSHYSK